MISWKNLLILVLLFVVFFFIFSLKAVPASACVNGTVTCYYDGDGDGYYASFPPPSTICLDFGSCADQKGGSWRSDINTTSCPYDSITSGFSGCEDCDDSEPMLTYLCCDPGKHFVMWSTTGINDPSSPWDSNDFAWSWNYSDLISDNSALNYFDIDSSNTRIHNKYLGACCPNATDCLGVTTSINSGLLAPGTDNAGFMNYNCISPTTNNVKIYGGSNDSTPSIYCGPDQSPDGFGSAWSDCDKDPSLCGFSSVIPGFPNPLQSDYNITINGSSQSVALHSSFGEFQFSNDTYTEACGDDANETLVYDSCSASSGAFSTPICCPNDGVVYAEYNGLCIPKRSCPDRQNGVPVWVPAPNHSLKSSWDAHLQNEGLGYCCDGTNTNKPLCGSSNSGCFVQERTLPLPTTSKDVCDNTLSDDTCVLETCSGSYDKCVDTQLCSLVPSEVDYSSYSNPSLVSDYTVDSTTQSYPVWSQPSAQVTQAQIVAQLSSCDPAHRCSAETVQVCNKSSDCDAFCEHVSGTTFTDCVETCSQYDCENFTVYLGDDCYAGCSIDGYKTVEKITSVTADTSTGGYADLNCGSDGCTGGDTLTPFSSGGSGGSPVVSGGSLSITGNAVGSGSGSSQSAPVRYFSSTSSCSNQMVCSSLPCVGGNPNNPANTLCFRATDNSGNPVYIRNTTTGDLFQCRGEDHQSDFINDGDPWCPKGFEYRENPLLPGTYSCSRVTKSCDSGFSGQLEHGCDDFTTNHTDNVWHQYTEECINRTYLPTPLNNYDRGCCLLTTIGGFDVYQYADVKIY